MAFYENDSLMMSISHFQDFMTRILPEGEEPVVIFSSVWPLLKMLPDDPQRNLNKILNVLLSLCLPKRSLLMPSFPRGYNQQGVCNLDHDPSTTGILSEAFRLYPGVRRSVSAFFPYCILGPHQEEVVALKPMDAWGDGSLYEWMENKNALFLMLGSHPTHCSYLHRMEWLAKDFLSYRYERKKMGKVIWEGQEMHLEENLYVRSLNPPVVNDFTVLQPCLIQGGMKLDFFENIPVATMYAQDMKKVFERILRQDPLVVVKNRSDYEIRIDQKKIVSDDSRSHTSERFSD